MVVMSMFYNFIIEIPFNDRDLKFLNRILIIQPLFLAWNSQKNYLKRRSNIGRYYRSGGVNAVFFSEWLR